MMMMLVSERKTIKRRRKRRERERRERGESEAEIHYTEALKIAD